MLGSGMSGVAAKGVRSVPVEREKNRKRRRSVVAVCIRFIINPWDYFFYDVIRRDVPYKDIFWGVGVLSGD
jgi:hypothetical protein